MRHLFAALLILIPAYSASAQFMRVHVIDVGQGAATLLEFDCGCALVDTGGEHTTAYGFDSTENLTEYLNTFFAARQDLRRTIDVLYLTHPHIDHTRGVKEVWKKYQVRNLVTNGSTASSSGSSQQNYVQALANGAEETDSTTDDVGYEGVTVGEIPAQTGLTNTVIDPLPCAPIDPKFTVLWGTLDTKPVRWTKADFKNQNNHSVVVRVDYGNSSLLIPGDIEEAAIHEIVGRYAPNRLLDVDVIQVAHHGSSNATTTELLQAESPLIAFIASGNPAREQSWTAWAHGHPNAGIVSLIQAAPSILPRTALQARVGNGAKKFSQTTITKAVYSVGWDGGLLLETAGDGRWTVTRKATVAPATGLLNLNTATQAELEGLPGIGQTRAKAIIAFRTSKGPIRSMEDLDRITGFGPSTIEALRPFVTFQ